MKLIRNNVFETNSSSTHTLTIGKQQKDYLAPSKTLTIDFIDTDKEFTLGTLKEKVSYLVSQIIEKYKYDVYDYNDLKEQVENDADFKRIANYVKDKYGKEVRLPKTYKVNTYKDEDDEEYTDIDEIVNINHQIRCYSLDELLNELVEERDLLDDVLRDDTYIEIGRD